MRCWWCLQVGRALSRLLNAILGGEGDSTFSAYSFELQRRGSWWGRARVTLVDGLLGAGHCEEGWRWHHERDLFAIDDKRQAPPTL